jgi:hypothetical protein
VVYSIGHLLDDFHGFDADGADPIEPVDDVFFVVGKFVGVEFLAMVGFFSVVSGITTAPKPS